MRFRAPGIGKTLENIFGAGEQHGSSDWDYHDISDHDEDMVNYNSVDSPVECNAFRGVPLLGPI